MTDYTKSTNFATKDSLPSGNPAKIVKGTEINTEFDNIATAVATKSNKASPTFTGTLTAADVSITGNTTLGNAATDTVTITADVASNVIPSADSTYTLGDSSNYWSHGYVDAVTTTGNVSVGGNLTVTGNATISGNLTFGDAATDTINLTADIASNILPSADNTYDIGGTGAEWKDIYINGVAYVDSIDLNGTAITATGAELNTLDGITATTAELNTLDGITATVTELNTLDGITATVTELNYTDGVTSAIQTQLDNKQPLSAVLTASTASFTTADETKLDGIETGATADQTASEILTALLTVDGTTSGLDADLLDGNHSTAFATAAQGTLADSALQSSDIGSSIQAYDSNLTSFVGTFELPTTDSTAGYVLKTDGSGNLSFVAQSDYDESTVAITGGSIDGTTIGATTASTGNFSTLSIGGTAITATATELNYVDGVTSNIQTQIDGKQASDADLTAIAALANTDGNFIVGSGSTWVAESGATARTSLGVGTADSVTFADVTDTLGELRQLPTPDAAKTASYTLDAGDVGVAVLVGTGGSVTIPDATLSADDIISVVNQTSGDITITCTITTAYVAGADVATCTLSAYGTATIVFTSGTVCHIVGDVA